MRQFPTRPQCPREPRFFFSSQHSLQPDLESIKEYDPKTRGTKNLNAYLPFAKPHQHNFLECPENLAKKSLLKSTHGPLQQDSHELKM